jgi:hypothetical protein
MSLLKAVFVFVACFFICGSLAQSQVNQVRRILVINELGRSPGVAAINRELVSASENSPYQIELYSESLDTPLFPTLLPKVVKHFKSKYLRVNTMRATCVSRYP